MKIFEIVFNTPIKVFIYSLFVLALPIPYILLIVFIRVFLPLSPFPL